MKLITREYYLNKLINVKGTPDIKVITGIRRSGKSKLLESYIDYIKRDFPDNNIIHINYNLARYEALKEYHELHDYVELHYIPGIDNIVLIDEVQMCTGFEKALIGLHTLEKYDIYITGSNAFLLNSDLATLLTGRTFKIEVYPFSFDEFIQYYECSDIHAGLDRYLLEGGMSGSYAYGETMQKEAYINDVFNTLVIRDIVTKYKIRRRDILEELSDYLMDNISNETSARKIAETLNSNKAETNNRTITTYINYLCNAFAFYRIRRYDISGKRYLASIDKYYLCDHSFRYAKLGTKNMNYGRTLENIVAIELLRRGYEIYTGVLYKKEIDFVAIKRNEKFYIQVCDNISDEKTFKREVTPLLKIKDAYPRMVIARTRHDDYQYEGIRIVDAASWLLSK